MALVTKLKHKLFFNSLLRTLIQGYLPNSIAAFSAVALIKFTSLGEITNGIFACLLTLVQVGLLIFSIIFLCRKES